MNNQQSENRKRFEKIMISSAIEIEYVAWEALTPHPRNYRDHPEDQIQHLIQSVTEHGFYRNVVIARDGTILAGHGLVKAVSRMGVELIPVIRLDIDPDSPQALKVLIGDNEIEHLAEQDDRLLSELLKEINDTYPEGLVGTGFDESMLANLIYVTRPASEIADFDAATHWVGMPEYEDSGQALKLVVSFRSEDDRQRFIQQYEIAGLNDKFGNTLTAWWPPKQINDNASIRFKG